MTTRFCPLHGDYEADDESTRCPECRSDPIGSSISLRQVKVVAQDALADDPPSELTPIADIVPCPICGKETALEDFRAESMGEIWTGRSAEFAEEGVCPECFQDVVAPSLRSWSDSEWLVHHYEGWRASIEAIHDVFVYDESPHESWLPQEERSRILSVEKTIEQRKAHLRRSQSAMLELLAKHSANITPPPFQMSIAAASEAVSPAAVRELEARRAKDLEGEELRRQDSVMLRAPEELEDDFDALGPGSDPDAHPPGSARRPWVVMLVGGLVVLGLALLLLAARG